MARGAGRRGPGMVLVDGRIGEELLPEVLDRRVRDDRPVRELVRRTASASRDSRRSRRSGSGRGAAVRARRARAGRPPPRDSRRRCRPRPRAALASPPSSAGIRRRPAGRGPGVVDGGRKLVLRRQAIVDGQDDGPRAVAERATDHVLGIEIADDPAAAVEEDDDRERPRADGGIDAAGQGTARARESSDRRCRRAGPSASG